MTVDRVEIDEVSHQQTAVGETKRGCHGAIEKPVIVWGLQHPARGPVGEDVGDLADGDDGASGCRGMIEQGGARRLDGEVAAVGGAREGGRVAADERPRYDAPDVQRIGKLTRDGAHLVKAIQAEGRLMGSDLDDGVDGGVDDGLAGSEVLSAQRLDDLDAGGVAIAENARQAATADQGFGKARREARNGIGEVTPVEVQRQARNFPMAGRRVLAPGPFRRAAPLGLRALGARQPGGEIAARELTGMAEAEVEQMGNAERPAGSGTRSGDMTNGIRTIIAIARCVGRAADTDGIEYEKEGARHHPPAVTVSRTTGAGGIASPIA